MGKKSRRQRPTNPVLPKPAKPAAPTAGSFPYGHLIPSSEIRAKPSTLDEAKAELICAAAALSPRRRSGQIRDWILEPAVGAAMRDTATRRAKPRTGSLIHSCAVRCVDYQEITVCKIRPWLGGPALSKAKSFICSLAYP